MKMQIPTGAYEIDDIDAYLKKNIGSSHHISLWPNNNTLKCELYCSLDVNYGASEHSIGRMLGFTANKVLDANKTHESDAPVDIIRVNTIRIRCNIVQGSYKNGENDHTLHSFYPTVEPGFKIVETPTNVQHVNNITLTIVDQEGDIVNFRGETITVRLHLKRLTWDCI